MQQAIRQMTAQQMFRQNELMNVFLSRKGGIVTVETEREMKVRKGEQPIMKVSEFQARVGVNYDNIASVQEKRATGELPEKNAGLPWGEWKVPNYIIEHKGELYVRMATLNNTFKRAPKFFRNGVEISADEARAASLASEFSTKEGDVFNIKLSTVKAVK